MKLKLQIISDANDDEEEDDEKKKAEAKKMQDKFLTQAVKVSWQK